MTKYPEVDALITKLLQTSWLAKPARYYIAPHLGHEAALNLYWTRLDKPRVLPIIDQNLPVWFSSINLANTVLDDIPVKEHITLMTPQRFYSDVVVHYPQVFSVYHSLPTWKKKLLRRG